MEVQQPILTTICDPSLSKAKAYSGPQAGLKNAYKSTAAPSPAQTFPEQSPHFKAPDSDDTVQTLKASKPRFPSIVLMIPSQFCTLVSCLVEGEPAPDIFHYFYPAALSLERLFQSLKAQLPAHQSLFVCIPSRLQRKQFSASLVGAQLSQSNILRHLPKAHVIYNKHIAKLYSHYCGHYTRCFGENAQDCLEASLAHAQQEYKKLSDSAVEAIAQLAQNDLAAIFELLQSEFQ